MGKHDLPFIPNEVDLDHLDWTQNPPRLLDRPTFQKIKQFAGRGSLPAEERAAKSKLKTYPGLHQIQNSVATVTFEDGKIHYLAYYQGIRHQKHLGEGAHGKVKWVQDQDSGAWLPVKVHYRNEAGKTEIQRAKKMDQFVGAYPHRKKGIGKIEAHQFMHFASGKKLYRWGQQWQQSTVDRLTFAEMFLACLEAIQAFHQKYLHNDLHNNNIIYDPLLKKAFIIDFGLSTEMIKEKHSASRKKKDLNSFLSSMGMAFSIWVPTIGHTTSLIDANEEHWEKLIEEIRSDLSTNSIFLDLLQHEEKETADQCIQRIKEKLDKAEEDEKKTGKPVTWLSYTVAIICYNNSPYAAALNCSSSVSII